MPKKKSVKIIQKENEPEVPAEILATAIEDIAKAMKKINSSRLGRNAIVILIQANSKVSRRDIHLVLNNLEAFEDNWLKPKK